MKDDSEYMTCHSTSVGIILEGEAIVISIHLLGFDGQVIELILIIVGMQGYL